MTFSFTYIIIIAAVLFFIVRQFMEQPIKPMYLLLMPALFAYFSYTALQMDMVKYAVSLPLLIAALVIGFLPGIVVGVLRSKNVRLRVDGSGTVYAKPGTTYIITWVALLVLRIAAVAVTYGSFAHGLVFVTLAATLISGLFLGNIFAEKASVYYRLTHMNQVSRQSVTSPLMR